MQEIENLRGAYDRVKDSPEYNPNQSALWLELRKAVELALRVLE